ncbi:MAG TPA: hypothetical protein VNZ64_24765 [Candidatus Acidoferrum sp.]|jgi:hypothetical protein|nr:hypothetical protein [Candidatus Acidoferrum sp.]
MSSEFQSIFARLRSILRENAATLSVVEDTSDHYCLEAAPGPATIQAWGGKLKRPMIPVAWVQVGKAYVSYHLMGMYGNDRLRDLMSKELKARMQGKTCFNFKTNDEALFKELEQLTVQAIAGFKKTGYISTSPSHPSSKTLRP